MACERVQQRTRTQVPHAHAVVCAAREEDELLDRLDGERVHGEVGGAALGPRAERADLVRGRARVRGRIRVRVRVRARFSVRLREPTLSAASGPTRHRQILPGRGLGLGLG